ncbi:flagellar basal body P-ring formation chaperone FlgA [Rhodobacteraceae bacterium]|nr:flagellar basal body P-ring formation chaperone FlgA [Paracoccaceae bacterium]
MIKRAALIIMITSPVYADAVVATRILKAGSIIQREDVKVTTEEDSTLRDLRDVVGFEAAYALYPNRPIQPDALRAPSLVDRNSMVQLIYNQRGLTIITEGRSLGRAGQGEGVRVMNLSSKRIVRGIAVDHQTVVVEQ